MPTIKLPICLPSYKSRGIYVNGSPVLMANMFPEKVMTMEGPGYVLITTPGHQLLATTANNAGARGRAHFTATGRLFSVNGNTLYEIASNGTATARGTISTATGHVSMADNGVHLLIADGTQANVFYLGTNTLTPIADANFPHSSLSVGFLNDRFIAVKSGTSEFRVSELDLADDWTPLVFATAESSADNIQAVICTNQKAYFVGERTTEVWYTNTSPTAPFIPIDGASIRVGTPSVASVAELNGNVFFLGSSDGARGSVWRISGTSFTRISTPSIEERMSTHTTSSSFSYCYQQEGHEFYGVTFPSNGATYFYDQVEDAWHQRYGSVINAVYPIKSIINAYGSSAELPYAFGSANGKIYTTTNSYNQIDGVLVGRTILVGPIFNGCRKLFHNNFRLGMEVISDGVPTIDVTVTLSPSDFLGAGANASVDRVVNVPQFPGSGINLTGAPQFSWDNLGHSYRRYYTITFSGAFRAIVYAAELTYEQEKS